MQKSLSENKRLKWKSLIEEQRQSGLSIKKWCQQKNLVPNTFHYWKERLSSKELQASSYSGPQKLDRLGCLLHAT